MIVYAVEVWKLTKQRREEGGGGSLCVVAIRMLYLLGCH